MCITVLEHSLVIDSNVVTHHVSQSSYMKLVDMRQRDSARRGVHIWVYIYISEAPKALSVAEYVRGWYCKKNQKGLASSLCPKSSFSTISRSTI